MFIIVGLGNPGRKYKLTRHNIGFIVIDQLLTKYNLSLKKNKLYSSVFTKIDCKDVLIIKPLTYMNLSGNALTSIFQNISIDISQLLIICDDINLPFGTIRFRSKGSDGGQKGLRSIIASISTQEFSRMRIGIGNKFDDIVDYVLSSFSKDEKEDLNFLINKAVEAVECFINNNMEITMSRFNRNILDNHL